MKNVEKKVIIINGASSGIGEETARVLAREGAKVVFSARREERLKKLADEIGENVGPTPDVIANAVLYAVSQPDNVAVPDLVVCPSMEG